MKDSPYSIPDQFHLSPLLGLLPNEGDVERLLENSDSFYARLERVKELRQALTERDQQTRLIAEEAMLQLFVSWSSQTGSYLK